MYLNRNVHILLTEVWVKEEEKADELCAQVLTKCCSEDTETHVSDTGWNPVETLHPAAGDLTAVPSLGIISLLKRYQCVREAFACLARWNKKSRKGKNMDLFLYLSLTQSGNSCPRWIGCSEDPCFFSCVKQRQEFCAFLTNPDIPPQQKLQRLNVVRLKWKENCSHPRWVLILLTTALDCSLCTGSS